MYTEKDDYFSAVCLLILKFVYWSSTTTDGVV